MERRPRGSRWPTPVAWLAGTFVLFVLSQVAAEVSRSHDQDWSGYWTWVVVQFVATAMVWIVPQVRQLVSDARRRTAEQREFDARVDMAVAMNDALDPIVGLLGQIAVEPAKRERDKLRAQAVPLVLATSATLIGPERARACWFELEAGPPRRLVPQQSVGRAGPASTVFTEGEPAGDAALAMVLADDDLLVDDVDEGPPPGWAPDQERDYRCFAAVPAIAGDTAYGMVTLDAPEPGDLSPHDLRLLRLMARSLAVALTQA